MSDFLRIISYHTNKLVYYKNFDGVTEQADEVVYDGIQMKSIGNPTLTFKNKNAKPSDYVMGIGMSSFPIVSSRFKDFLSSYLDKKYLQFFECKTNYNKKEKFYAMNILETIDCFDWEKSTYKKRTYAIDENRFWADNITNVEFLNEKINGRNIFRCTECSTNIFISKKIEEEILRQKFLVTLVRSQNINDIIDADSKNPILASWGHENL